LFHRDALNDPGKLTAQYHFFLCANHAGDGQFSGHRGFITTEIVHHEGHEDREGRKKRMRQKLFSADTSPQKFTCGVWHYVLHSRMVLILSVRPAHVTNVFPSCSSWWYARVNLLKPVARRFLKLNVVIFQHATFREPDLALADVVVHQSLDLVGP